MAYGNKYRGGFSSKNIQGYIYIDQEDYSGAVTDVIITPGTTRIRYSFGGWNVPVIGLTASFEILNNQADFFTLIPLITAEEREYRVRIVQTSPSAFTMFSGFLNSETNEITYLKNRPFRLNASSYLSKLQYVKPSLIETLENRTFIDIINACLALTGSLDPIRVNSKLYPTGSSLGTGQTLFNRSGIFNEIFWKDNIDRDNALEIIEKILSAFDCYLYWFNGSWYIERYEDLWNNPQNYVVYASGSSYGYTSSGTTAQTTDASLDFSSLVLKDQSQTFGSITGLREIEVRLEQQTLFNLTVNDMTNASDVNGVVPYPGYRSWQKWNEGSGITWVNPGLPWKNISNAILRQGWIYDGGYETWRGLYTRFKITKDSSTSLTVKFKFATLKGVLGTFTGSWSDYVFNFKWYLRHTPGNYFIVDNAGTWERQSGTEESKIQTLEIQGSDMDPVNDSMEVTLSIPIGEVSGISDGDNDFVLCLGTELISKSGGALTPAFTCFYGDVFITASAPLENNNISGVLNTGFLDKKEITLKMYDAGNVNIKNGILTGSDLTTRTSTWTSDGILSESLAKRIIRNKFQLYNRTRVQLSSTIKSSSKFKPLFMFTDSFQAGKKFVLTSYGYSPDKDEYEMTLSEYDNTETITFV